MTNGSHPNWRSRAAVLGLTLWLGSAGAASANGYLFFHDHALEAKGGTVYVGLVSDDAGRPLAGAQVSLEVVAVNQSLTVDTDARGRYRFSALDGAIKPAQVRVTVLKPGYKLLRAVNMTRARTPDQPIETNFILARR